MIADDLRSRADAIRCVVRWHPGAVATESARDLPLAGFGVAHKDIFELEGWRPGCGHDDGAPVAGTRTAPIVRRLSEAGAAPVASLAMAEHACGATARNDRMPSCLHPWHPTAALGGSSSGSAAAVSIGLVRGSLGSDTFGSVRIPAATCGVLGLKPTYGVLPVDGMAPLAPSLDTVGLLARTTDDLQQLWNVARGTSLRPEPSGSRLRVAAWLPPKTHGVVEAALRLVMSLAAGNALVDQLDGFDAATKLGELMLHGEAAVTLAETLQQGTASAGVRAVALPGAALPPPWLRIAANARPDLLRRFVERHFAECDVMLLPALEGPVPDRRSVDPQDAAFEPRTLFGLYRFMGFANYLGVPALVFPVARDDRGLPVCVQAIARPYHEDHLIDLARRCAREASRRGAAMAHFHGDD